MKRNIIIALALLVVIVAVGYIAFLRITSPKDITIDTNYGSFGLSIPYDWEFDQKNKDAIVITGPNNISISINFQDVVVSQVSYQYPTNIEKFPLNDKYIFLNKISNVSIYRYSKLIPTLGEEIPQNVQAFPLYLENKGNQVSFMASDLGGVQLLITYSFDSEFMTDNIPQNELINIQIMDNIIKSIKSL